MDLLGPVVVATTGEAGIFVVLCAVCGLLGALVMDVPMARQEDGFTPAYVATSVLSRSSPGEVAFGAAFALHHLTGILAGLLYAVLYLFVAAGAPNVAVFGGIGLFPHIVATTLVAGVVYAFFAHLVFPRAGGWIYEERATAVSGRWLRSTAVFGSVLGIVVPAATTLL
ncbi:MAG: hypothetical protein ABEI27_10995 [Halobellus sp.]|uniref:hypothetical protein n=1 Tax=Halobellus sp. TaxID=1979212 RepID=UPI0035D4D7F1